MSTSSLHRSALAALVAIAAVVLCAAPPAEAARPPPAAESGVLAVGSRGPAVRALQRELRARGFAIATDGRYGPRTRGAVLRLQRRLGLRANGVVDRPLLWWLGLSVCGLPGPAPAPAGLRLGSYGPRVCALQRALRRSGFPVGVDGGYGPLTRDTVRRAQRRLGMAVTGVAGDRLLERLRAIRPRPRGRPGARPPAAALLSVGAKGRAVRRLQAALRRQGFAVAVDGLFGPRTRLAVARLQRRLGRPVNGAADAPLLRRLDASRATRLAAFPVDGPHWFQNDFGAPRHQGRHEGNDIFAARGTPVVAVANGAVERMTRTPRGLGGVWLWLRADDGTGYYYAHMRGIATGLTPGVRVTAGQVLGLVGRTGDARRTPFHLHFEMHPRGRGAVNPYAALRAVDPASAVAPAASPR